MVVPVISVVPDVQVIPVVPDVQVIPVVPVPPNNHSFLIVFICILAALLKGVGMIRDSRGQL